MKRDNRRVKMAILMVALLATIGLGFGCLTEDLCAVGGSHADDPASPVALNEFALPLRLQTPLAAVSALISVPPLPDTFFSFEHPWDAARAVPAASLSIDTSRRC